MIIPATKADGSACLIEFEDKGDAVPAYRRDGSPFDAWTSAFRIFSAGDWQYVQVDKAAVMPGTNPLQLRESEDIAALDAAGIDASTLDFDKAK